MKNLEYAETHSHRTKFYLIQYLIAIRLAIYRTVSSRMLFKFLVSREINVDRNVRA